MGRNIGNISILLALELIKLAINSKLPGACTLNELFVIITSYSYIWLILVHYHRNHRMICRFDNKLSFRHCHVGITVCAEWMTLSRLLWYYIYTLYNVVAWYQYRWVINIIFNVISRAISFCTCQTDNSITDVYPLEHLLTTWRLFGNELAPLLSQRRRRRGSQVLISI